MASSHPDSVQYPGMRQLAAIDDLVNRRGADLKDGRDFLRREQVVTGRRNESQDRAGTGWWKQGEAKSVRNPAN